MPRPATLSFRAMIALGILVLLAATPGAARADDSPSTLVVPSVFSDHAVLQRGMPVPVWGKGTPGELVTVRYGEHRVATKVDPSGRWRVDLPPLETDAVGRPLMIRSGEETITCTDVLVGEVWVASGQSNMEWPVAASNGADEAIVGGNHPRFRLLEAPHRLSLEPVFSTGARWQRATPETIGDFSAVATAFALHLIETLDVPVGILAIHWGGTRAEPWTDRRFLAKHPRFTPAVAAFEKELAAWRARDPEEIAREHAAAVAAYERRMEPWWKAQLSRDRDFSLSRSDHSDWTAARFDASRWPTKPVPGLWRDHTPEWRDFDGIGRYRRVVNIPTSWSGKSLALSLGPIDDADTVWFDGRVVGRTTHSWNTPRRYTIPAELVTPGTHAIAIAVLDTGGAGGMTGSAGDYRLECPEVTDSTDGAISLAGPWFVTRGVAFDGKPGAARPRPPASPAERNSAPGLIHDGMLRPFIPYAIRGATWYQGESNAGEPEAYRDLLPLMITSWRAAWGQGNFPFGIVQLAGFRAPSEDPNQGGWAFLRDAQRHAHRVSVETGLIVTTDIGDADDIHPRNKHEVGRRLALWALAKVYGQWHEHSGPTFTEVVRPVDGVEPAGSAMQIFVNNARGLRTRDGAPAAGFGVSSDGKTWHWATGTIAGQSITVRHPEGTEIRHIRYAWSDNPVRANVENSDGLPMEPFRWDAPMD